MRRLSAAGLGCHEVSVWPGGPQVELAVVGWGLGGSVTARAYVCVCVCVCAPGSPPHLHGAARDEALPVDGGDAVLELEAPVQVQLHALGLHLLAADLDVDLVHVRLRAHAQT